MVAIRQPMARLQRLSAGELERFDAMVTPRIGAERQASAIASSRLNLAVCVSCDPSSFARDARILIDGGFRLERVLPIDQFSWASHLELVGVFRR